VFEAPYCPGLGLGAMGGCGVLAWVGKLVGIMQAEAERGDREMG